MRKRLIPVTMAVSLLLVLLPGTGRALSGVSPWVGGIASIGWYAMGDVNEDIRAVDAFLPISFDEVSKGMGYGGSAGIDLTSGFSLAFHFERLNASAEVSDDSGSLLYEFPANTFYGTLEYEAPSESGSAFGVGVGIGTIRAVGSVSLSLADIGSESGSVSGSGTMFQGYGLLNFSPRGRATAVALFGYRRAKTESIEVGGVPWEDVAGGGYDIDYSGFVASLSVRIHVL